MFGGSNLVNQCNGESCPNCAYFLFFLVIFDPRVESELVLSSDIMAETLTHHAAQMQAKRAALVVVVKQAQKGLHIHTINMRINTCTTLRTSRTWRVGIFLYLCSFVKQRRWHSRPCKMAYEGIREVRREC